MGGDVEGARSIVGGLEVYNGQTERSLKLDG